jgi:NADPH:quinone reductase-like Zn-dependent oxidoreductase
LKGALPSVDGSSIHWRIGDLTEPKAGEGQILVRVRASSINRGETVLLRTKLPAGAGGIDAAGEVVALGPKTSRFRVGDRVAGRCAGGFAELAAMNEFEGIAIPREVSFEEAACLPVSFVVAHDAMVVQGRFAAGESVLITGASSAVGVAALSLARYLGAATVIGTSRSAAKLEKLKSLGLGLGLEAGPGTLAPAVKKATGDRGVDIAIDTVVAALFRDILDCLAIDGRYATIGQMTGSPKVELDMDAFAARRFHLFGVSNRLRTPAQKAGSAQRFAAEIMPAIVRREVRPIVDAVFPLHDVEAAHQHVYADRQVGKVVIRV